jgi:1,2-diacylglycerol 3-alpha-glucosyltransferase
MSPLPARPLRVAIFAESYLPYLSGVTVSTEALARGLRAAGHQVLLVAPRPVDGAEPSGAGASGPAPSYAWLPSYQAPLPTPPGYRMPWPLPSQALRAVRTFAPDVIHAQSPFVSGLMARRLAQRSGAPLIFTHHTRFSDYGHYLGPLAGVAGRTLEAYLHDFWAGCAAVIAPGGEHAEEIQRRLGARRRPVVRAIPSGIDVVAIQRLAAVDLRAAHGWPREAVVVVSHGRLAPEKNVELLVEAFARAAAGDVRLRLLLIGDGPSAPAIAMRTSQPDLAGRVSLSGRLPRMAALAMVRSGDLYAFASQTETQGLVLAEALVAGLPVVALAGPGVRDSVRHGVDGVVVEDAASPQGVAGTVAAAGALGAAIAALAADLERRAAMAHAATQGAQRFDVGRRVTEVVSLYRELLSSPGKS